MRRHRAFVCVALACLSLPVAFGGEPPTRDEVERMMGLRSEGDRVRGQLDTTGYVATVEQAEDLMRATARDAAVGEAPLLGGICPHDDHLYSAAVTRALTDRIAAPTVVLIGVFHKARLWGLEDRLVFDAFGAWHGPWGPVEVDPLRDGLVVRLDPSSYVADNTMHCREHSLEGILPLLQYRNRDVRVVPILVPYMGWGRMEHLAAELAATLSAEMDARGLRLGRDVAVVISNDAVHYGPDFDHAPFGTGIGAYQRATGRDRRLIADHLEGPIRGAALRSLLHTLVDEDDVHRYRIPWCGRFAVPFGLELLRRTAELQGRPVPEGVFLRYGTSLEGPQPEVSPATRAAGLGTTGPSNLHHWVGFFSLGVR